MGKVQQFIVVRGCHVTVCIIDSIPSAPGIRIASWTYALSRMSSVRPIILAKISVVVYLQVENVCLGRVQMATSVLMDWCTPRVINALMVHVQELSMNV